MADYVTVANLALGKVGESYRITDPNEGSHPARLIAGAWDMARLAVLRRGKFNFSMRRAELAAQAATDPGYETPYPYSNRFPLPIDLVRLVEVLGPADVVECYRDEGRAILANSDGPVYVRYVRDVVEIGAWDDLAVQAFAARLGYEIADPLTGDRNRKTDCWAEFRANTGSAAGVDAKEDPPERPYDSSWVTARGGSAVGGPPNV